MTIARCLVASIVFAAATCCGQAQTLPSEQPMDLADFSAPSFTTFSTRDGVPDSVTVGVQTDLAGFVWLASADGLARYDGREWNAKDALAIRGTLGTFTVDHTGALWVAFRDQGVARWDGHAWQLEDHTSGMPSDYVRRVIETSDADGHYDLWAATFGSGLLKRSQDHWIASPDTAGLPTHITSVVRTHRLGGHERLWAGTLDAGLWYREDGTWQRFHDERFNVPATESMLAVEHGGEEELWITTIGDGLWRLDRNGPRHWSVASGELPSDDLYELAQSRLANGEYAVWIASRGGLLRVHNDHVQVFDRRHGLPSNAVRGVSVWRSPEGIEVLWLATEAGVARAVLGGSQWQTVSLMGANSTGAFGVLPEPDGSGGQRLWVAAASDGLGLYERGLWHYFSRTDGTLPGNDVRMIKRALDDKGEAALWLGLEGGQLLRVRDGPVFEPVSTPWTNSPAEAVLDVLGRKIDGHVERWFATRDSGIHRQSDGIWSAYQAKGVAAPWSVVQLIEQIDAHGRHWLWATSKQGLARYDGNEWDASILALPDRELYDINLLPDAQGRAILWIGSRNRGIIRVDATDPLHPVLLPDDLPPAPDPTAYSALRDSRGHIYICTNAGVQLLVPAASGYQSRVFTHHDGLLHAECNSNSQFIDAHDRFWTGTLGGATVFDPVEGIRDTTAKPLKLLDVRIDNQIIPAEHIQIPPGRHELRVDFALLSWNRESESLFRTQLLNYESAPGAWTTQNFRNFNGLPPGQYVLRLEARDYAGNPSTPIEIPFEMVPMWWQEGWAYVLFAVSAALVAAGLVQWRTHSLNAQRRNLERQVVERTTELHQANSRLLELSYKDALTGLANRRRLLETLELGAKNEDRSSHMVALIFVDVDHFKDYNDRFGHPAGDEALRCIADAMRTCTPAESLVARYGGEEFACILLDSDLAQAREVAERIRAAVAACAVPVPGTDTINHVTISAGVARGKLETAAAAHSLLRDADIALYQAKRDGRNCVRG